MLALTPLFTASTAFLAAVAASGHPPAVHGATSDVIFSHNEDPIMDHIASPLGWREIRRISPLVTIALLTATVAAVFLVHVCFVSLTESKHRSSFGVNERKLASGNWGGSGVDKGRPKRSFKRSFVHGAPCKVGLGKLMLCKGTD